MAETKKFVIDDTPYETRLTRKFENRRSYIPADSRRIHAAIPGIIERVHVKPRDKVKRGESLLVLEAMKMKNEISAGRDGVVLTVCVRAGQMVTKGQILVELE